jgi:hypothetical protein
MDWIHMDKIRDSLNIMDLQDHKIWGVFWIYRWLLDFKE